MRIGIFLDEWRDGGVPVFLERLEQYLTGEGHEVLLFVANAFPKRESLARELYFVLKNRLNLRCICMEIHSYPKEWRLAHFRETIFSRKIDCLLISHFYDYIPYLEAVSDKVPLVSVAHADADYYYGEFFGSFDFCVAHVAVSQRIFDKCRLLSPPDFADRIRFLPYGISAEADFLAEPVGKFRVIYCARLDPIQKRCQDLIPIWKEYRRLGGDGELVILGDGKGAALLRSHFAEEIAAGSVVMRNHVPAPEALREISRGDVLLNVSNFEGLPQTVLEGASLGLYPLLSDIESGHREIVETLGFGTVRHVGDWRAFAQELFRLGRDLTDTRALRPAIRKVALEHYSFEKCGAKYLDVFARAVSMKPTGSQPGPDTYRPTLKTRAMRAIMRIKYRRHFKQK